MSRELIQQLKINRKMSTDMQIRSFLSTFDLLRQQRSSSDCMLPYLLHVLDDSCEQIDVMESFLTFIIEYYVEDSEHYIHFIVKETPFLLVQAKNWLLDIYRGLLPTKSDSLIVQREIESLPDELRNVIVRFLSDELPRSLTQSSRENLTRILGI